MLNLGLFFNPRLTKTKILVNLGSAKLCDSVYDVEELDLFKIQNYLNKTKFQNLEQLIHFLQTFSILIEI